MGLNGEICNKFGKAAQVIVIGGCLPVALGGRLANKFILGFGKAESPD
mgnify:CR=1 FL=1